MRNSTDALNVLVVDDEEDIREGCARIVGRMGCRVFKASRGEEALGILREETVHIALLDLKMPGIDGMEVLRETRKIDENILVIVITGYATVETAIAAMKQGAYDFISKPFDPDQLRIVVNRAWEKLRLTWEAQRLERQERLAMLDLYTEKSRLRTILESLPNGVLVTNAEGQVVLMNPTLQQDLGVGEEIAPGRPVEEVISDRELCRLILEVSRGKYLDFEDLPAYEFSPSEGKFMMARLRPVLSERAECLGAVASFADISTMKVLDRLKSEFVAKVSHELRSPLSTIHEQLAMVINHLVDDTFEKDQYLLSRAKEKTRGLISLIGDLLDLSRIEAGSVCQEVKSVRLDELLKGIVEFLQTQAQSKKQSLTLELPETPLPPLTADPLALESIFGNLITNAITYTPEGGRITVRAGHSGINIRVDVTDNGIGIEGKYLDKIFERFYRVRNEKTRFITGTGLGLPIVKALAGSLGGIVEVDSAPGEGSTFTVLLPTAKSEERIMNIE